MEPNLQTLSLRFFAHATGPLPLMDDINQTLANVVDALRAEGIAHAVVGSVGARAWGLRRTTQDVDIIMLAIHERTEELIARISGDDTYVPADDARRVLRSGGSFNVLNLETLDKVDVFVAQRNEPFTVSRLARRIPAKVEGVDTWVASAEDIILAKLRWRLTTRSDRQWQDCLTVAPINQLDFDYLRSWADRLGIRDDLETLIAEITPLMN